jgi:hypothetical protein
MADAKIGSTAAIKVSRQGHALDFKLPIVTDSRRR